MLPSMNHLYYVYLNLALWLEVFLDFYTHADLTPLLFDFSSDVRGLEGVNLSKGIASDIIGNKLFETANNE